MTQANQSEERQALCSGCLGVVPESRVHVIPFFNDTLRGYVTTYRCERCWLPSPDETRTRLANTPSEAEVASAATFFGRYGHPVDEFRRNRPTEEVRAAVGRLLDRLRSEELRLVIGPAIPL